MSLEIPTLTTGRLRLEPLSMRHSRGMYDTWRHPEVQQYSGPAADEHGNPIALPATTHADSDRLIRFWLKAAGDGWGFRWALLLRQDDTFVGHIGFNALGGCAEIAYHMNPAFWGNGYMAEAADAAVSWLRLDTAAEELEAFIEPENTASIALAMRLGMHPTDELSESARRYRMSLRGP